MACSRRFGVRSAEILTFRGQRNQTIELQSEARAWQRTGGNDAQHLVQPLGAHKHPKEAS
jgi:hypothetical protein